jgi:hypothetical protein
VVALKTHHLRAAVLLKVKNGIDARARVGAAIDVIAKEHHGVVRANTVGHLREEIDQRREITVDVADRYGRHVNEYRFAFPRLRLRPAAVTHPVQRPAG